MEDNIVGRTAFPVYVGEHVMGACIHVVIVAYASCQFFQYRFADRILSRQEIIFPLVEGVYVAAGGKKLQQFALRIKGEIRIVFDRLREAMIVGTHEGVHLPAAAVVMNPFVCRQRVRINGLVQVESISHKTGKG